MSNWGLLHLNLEEKFEVENKSEIKMGGPIKWDEIYGSQFHVQWVSIQVQDNFKLEDKFIANLV